MLQQIMTHLGLPHDPAQREEPATDAASLDVLAAAAAASHPPPPREVVRFLFDLCTVSALSTAY